MPRSAPRPCSFNGCNVLVHDGSGRCASHPRATWVKAVPVKRITGRRLQAMRAALFSRNPFCAECNRQGHVKLATQRDHIISLADGGLDDESNEQGLCTECHDAKSKKERIAGRKRA
jgi:5-methylcytosine-specific restriction protein A